MIIQHLYIVINLKYNVVKMRERQSLTEKQAKKWITNIDIIIIDIILSLFLYWTRGSYSPDKCCY